MKTQTPSADRPLARAVAAAVVCVALTLPTTALARTPTSVAPPTQTSGRAEVAAATTVPDQAWAPLLQREVELVVHDGTLVTGTLIGLDATTVTLIGGDGVVKVQSKSAVVLMRAVVKPVPPPVPVDVAAASTAVPVPPKAPPPTGRGLFATGLVLTSIGSVMWATSIGLATATESDGPFRYRRYHPLVWAPMLASSILHLGAGIPMLAIGAKRRRAHRGFERGIALTPGPLGTRGVSAGLRLRF